uniref:Uncharacterized protein n=1 Tax=Strigamia maritima TaxID=126957 RepID=T1IZM2_STRMM
MTYLQLMTLNELILDTFPTKIWFRSILSGNDDVMLVNMEIISSKMMLFLICLRFADEWRRFSEAAFVITAETIGYFIGLKIYFKLVLEQQQDNQIFIDMTYEYGAGGHTINS